MRSLVYLLTGALALACQNAPGETNAQSQSTLSGSLSRVWTKKDDKLTAPVWLGNEDKGALIMPLWRGAATGIEDHLFTPPDGDCTDTRGLMRVDWNSEENTVRYQLKFKKVPVHPSVHRTEGVDYFPNPIYGAPKDFEDGGYRFWTLLTAITGVTVRFYYDFTTLKYIGSEYDFPEGPPPAIGLDLPVFTLFTTHLIFPEEDGSMYKEYTVPYDAVTVEGGAYSFAYATYIPLDLCQAHPVQPTLGQLRTWVGPWLPPEEAPTWRDVLKNAPAFDLTADENKPFPETNGFEPYVFSGIAFLGNNPNFQGGVPNGYRASLPSLILQVAPGIRPIEGGNGPNCKPTLIDPHVTAPRFCEMQASGGAQ